MVISEWLTQNWFPIMTQLFVDYPHPFPAHEIHIETITTPREQIMFNVPKTPASSHTFIQEAMGD